MTNAVHGSPSVGGYHALHDFQLEAFQSQEHPEQLGGFRVVREPTGVFDGKVFPSTDAGFTYVMGWLYGYRANHSLPERQFSRPKQTRRSRNIAKAGDKHEMGPLDQTALGAIQIPH